MLKPRLTVIGLGQYYRKLAQSISNYFTQVLTLDANDVPHSESGLRTLILQARSDAVMLLTPNQLHIKHLLELTDLRLPTFVEKPLVTTERDLSALLRNLHSNPRLYCSDSYLDVRAVPLLDWFGKAYPPCLKEYIKIQNDKIDLRQQGFPALGEIRTVEGVLLEGEGQAKTFDGREWLWDPVHGGVLWDLGYHLLTVWHALFHEPLSVTSVVTKSVTGAPATPAAETFAQMKLHSKSGKEFCIKVGKYHEGGNERWLKINGSRGQVEMEFQECSTLTVQLEALQYRIVLEGSQYSHIVEAFREYLEGGATRPHGLEPALAATRLIISVKERIKPRTD